MNLGFNLDDGVDEESDDVTFVCGHGLVHARDLVASVGLNPEQLNTIVA